MKILYMFAPCLILFCLSFTNASYFDGGFEPMNGPSVTYKYDRIDEVMKECSSILASASELQPNDDRLFTIKEELSFVNGDWWQELSGAPLMPFDDRDVSINGSMDLRSPLQLASFWVSDVDRAHRYKKSVSVSGVLQIGITLQGSFAQQPFDGSPHFDIWPGHSQLTVSFEGIYTESKQNGRERVMCLLGTTMLPSRQPDSTDPWWWVKVDGYTNQSLLLQDDQILLVIRYPRTFNLTKRAVQGSIKSLNPKSNPKYFDEVRVSSWLGTSANYEFGSEKLVAKACNPYPYKDNLTSGGIDMYKGLDFCLILERFTHQDALTIAPNWRCNGTDEFCSKLGPFVLNKAIKATDGSFKDVKLALQDVRCGKKTSQGSDGLRLTKVSAVFRAISPFEDQFASAQRTGLNNMTLSSEGIWKPSSGQLCMVGCLGIVDPEGSNGCDSRICLYVPLSFSIKQRSIIVGTLSSINGSSKSYFPLSFEKLVRPAELWDQYTASHPYYKYTKIDSAAVVLEKNEPSNFGTVIKKSLLKYPKIEDTESYLTGLSLLSEDLTLQISAVPDPVPNTLPPRTNIQMEILSIGTLFGRYWSSNSSFPQEEAPYQAKAESTEKQLLLNVSAQLSLTGKLYNNFSALFVEGLYNPLVGNMYLIGCRDVRASWNVLHESMDLEAGLDCLIEVVVSYPPTTARWLVSPTACVSISSQRTEDDPLYFSPIKLKTLPIMYRKQREDILSRRGVEGILRVLTLSVAIICIFSQLFYMRDNVESVPYISLVMLGVQALGYSLPLITGAEALFKKMGTESYETQSYDLEKSQWIRVIEYTVKLLVLVSFSLTLRLGQKVWKSRIRLLTRAPLEPHRVPIDKRVFIVTFIIHVVGYVSVLIIHSANTIQKPLRTDMYMDSTGNVHAIRQWETELEEYVGLVQDFFLLPQIIANLVWQIDCKPLRNFYFIGITLVRLMPHVYDYTRSPVRNPYFSEEYEFVNPNLDFYSKFGDIAIPATAVFLAVIVYVQQRWSYEKLSQTLILGKCKLLPLGSKVYERLPSIAFESELVFSGNGNLATEKEHDED